MGDGYTADPSAIRAYSKTVRMYAGLIGQAGGAVQEIMTDNSVNLGRDPLRSAVLGQAGLPDTGNRDMAYGIICQPAGELLESVQQTLRDGLGRLASMMDSLSGNLGDAGQRYAEREITSKEALQQLRKAVDETRPVPGGLSGPVVPGQPMPTIPTFPGPRAVRPGEGA